MLSSESSPEGECSFDVSSLPTSDVSSSRAQHRPTRKSHLRRAPNKLVPTHVLLAGRAHSSKQATRLWLVGACCLLFMTISPIYLLESIRDPEHHSQAVHGVHLLLDMAHQMKVKALALNTIRGASKNAAAVTATADQPLQKQQRENVRGPRQETMVEIAKKAKSKKDKTKKDALNTTNAGSFSAREKQDRPKYTLEDLKDMSDEGKVNRHNLARGSTGRPASETPALVGAQRAHIRCDDLNVDSLAYWNDPVGHRDLEFRSPFTYAENTTGEITTQFITFSPDCGGWNNMRMSMENLFVLALVTGRTLVLPPKLPIYLLDKDKAARNRGFADFFPLDNPNFPVKIMSMQDFLNMPAQQALLAADVRKDKILNVTQVCDERKVAENSCVPLFEYLSKVGHSPEFSCTNTCLIFDEAALKDGNPSADAEMVADTYCGETRNAVFWNNKDHGSYGHLHLQTSDLEYRLLTHFYNMIFFSDPAIGNYVKRFVRDYLHYNDAIYCAAGKIVKAVQKEGLSRGFALDSEGGGGYSALHIRRGDLQFKEVIISALEWYNNTKEIWQDREILYVATDERNMTFFDELAKYHDLRFLDNYWELAGLGILDPNYMGMIETIVASRGRAFAGTWFSTFSGYINRLRGYHGMSMQHSWYSFLPRKTAMHTWKILSHSVYAFEYPDGWVGIDADTWPKRDSF